MTSLSIIIPAYNEAQRIAPALTEVLEFKANRQGSTEIIVVDDGSSDATIEVCRTVGGSDVRVISQPRNRGKGHAVRTGMLAAGGDHRLFTDADGSTPIEEYAALKESLAHLGGSGVAFGSIAAPGANVERSQAGIRPALGKLGNLLIRAIALPGVQDSQRGFKLFSADAAKATFSRCVIDGWGFDVEALALAQRLGFPTAEVPVRWTHIDGGTITPTSYLTTLVDVTRVRLRLLRGAYDLETAGGRRTAAT